MLDASVVDARNDAISASIQASNLVQGNAKLANVDRTEATARHCEQLAQVLFASQHLFPKSPLRKTCIRIEFYTDLFCLENNLNAVKASSALESYHKVVETFEGQ